MKYLSKAQIIAINKNQIDVFGGNFVPPHNLLHEENLDYLLDAVEAEMFGEPIYPEIHQKAALYFFNIVSNHVFQDGNKRTGLQSAMIFLLLNGYSIDLNDNELIQFTLSVASGEKTLEEVQAWIKAHMQKGDNA